MRLDTAECLKVVDGRRSVAQALGGIPVAGGLSAERLGPVEVCGRSHFLPKYVFRGGNSSDPIRIGVFGGVHGDEPAGTLGALEFILELLAEPEFAENFLLSVYPICNPTGFEDQSRCSRSGRDLNREFWRGSAEPEIRLLEQELRASHFSGIVQLHSDDTSEGIYGFVRGHTLTENLLRPALRAAGAVLPRNVNATIDGFAARDGIIYDQYQGILAAPADMDPMPFEIVLETPQEAPVERQVEALVVALRTILGEYRRLVSFAANI